MPITQRLKDKVDEINHALAQNKALGKAVRFQHQHLPLPLPLFDMLFRTRVGSKLLYSYGRHVYHAGYESRRSNEDFWTSREAIYHHLYMQRQVLWNIIELLKQEPEITSFLLRGDLAYLEIGFGLGRTSRAMMEEGLLRWRSYYAMEPNAHLCDYVRRRFGERLGMTFEVHPGRIQDLLTSALRFDVFLVTGGVLMYCPEATLEAFFASLPQHGCRYLLILREGSPAGDFERKMDKTAHTSATQYDFRSRLAASYPQARFITHVGSDGLYDYFCMMAD
ncbi:MAG: hypothetical protein USCGTAYLOR_01320 [Chromatiales bacterium USCg_Taylor]|nr:MAG: hypothetical protein USCGTAYLOR_01320 [Chromatiales bacterium USCg_Taylor]